MIKLNTKTCVWREGKEEKEEGNHRLSPCETSDRKQDWREVADDAGLGCAGQTAHHALCKEAATELLLEININKEMEARRIPKSKGKNQWRSMEILSMAGSGSKM